MKIQGNRPENEAAIAQQKVDRAASEGRQAAAAAAKSGPGDRVALSSDAALANAAARAAAEAPDVRTDLVERMRALIDRGELGEDADKLADSLIDSMLGSK